MITMLINLTSSYVVTIAIQAAAIPGLKSLVNAIIIAMGIYYNLKMPSCMDGGSEGTKVLRS